MELRLKRAIHDELSYFFKSQRTDFHNISDISLHLMMVVMDYHHDSKSAGLATVAPPVTEETVALLTGGWDSPPMRAPLVSTLLKSLTP